MLAFSGAGIPASGEPVLPGLGECDSASGSVSLKGWNAVWQSSPRSARRPQSPARTRISCASSLKSRPASIRSPNFVAHDHGQTVLFDAVAAEAAGLIHGEAAAAVVRFAGDRACTILATHNGPTPVGSTVQIHADDVGVVPRILRTGRSARWDDDSPASPDTDARPTTASIQSWRPRSPSTTGCRFLLGVATTGHQLRRTPSIVCNRSPSSFPRRSPMPRALPSSRRPMPRSSRPATKPACGDVRDGAQRRLVQTIISLKLARAALSEGRPAADHMAEALIAHAQRANDDLRELVRRILPAALSRGVCGADSILVDDIKSPDSAERDRAPTSTNIRPPPLVVPRR